ncbi:MAG: amidohydrolase [Bacteroidia bacterium]|nr:MAG: amidohydrolase [Bacteroidia bacterium]
MDTKYSIYNCHIHTFRREDVPRGFLPAGLVGILNTRLGFWLVSKTLDVFFKVSDENIYQKYLQFIDVGSLPSQEEIFLRCYKQYPKNARFIIHAIDMRYMNAGLIPREYKDQLRELEVLYKKYPDNIIPFIQVDPRRPDGYQLFRDAMEKGFRGVKLYPAMGHTVSDKNLIPVYEYCNANKIPVLVHCGPQSPVNYRTSARRLKKMLDDAGIPYEPSFKARELAAQFGHPVLYIPILEKYPDMHICFAHWGSEVSWDRYLEDPADGNNWFHIIRFMLEKYPNLYTDISFTLHNEAYFPVLKVFLEDDRIRPKVLFGTDYYMVKTRTPEKKFGFDIRAFLGEGLFRAIAHDNPRRFLHDHAE